jgi:hypothetical protein
MRIPPDPSEIQTVVCPSCGYANPVGLAQCEKCRSDLIARIDLLKIPVRPGCVTVYAVLLFAGTALLVAGGLPAFLLNRERISTAIAFLVGLWAAAGVIFVVARGLWKMEEWARISIIVLQSLAILGSACAIVTSWANLSAAVIPTSMLQAVAGLVISAYIIYWFATHGDLFV